MWLFRHTCMFLLKTILMAALGTVAAVVHNLVVGKPLPNKHVWYFETEDLPLGHSCDPAFVTRLSQDTRRTLSRAEWSLSWPHSDQTAAECVCPPCGCRNSCFVPAGPVWVLVSLCSGVCVLPELPFFLLRTWMSHYKGSELAPSIGFTVSYLTHIGSLSASLQVHSASLYKWNCEYLKGFLLLLFLMALASLYDSSVSFLY